MTAGLSSYGDLNAEVIGISVDSPFAQEAWAQKEKIGITLVSDLNKAATNAYDVLFPGLAGIGDTSARAATSRMFVASNPTSSSRARAASSTRIRVSSFDSARALTTRTKHV